MFTSQSNFPPTWFEIQLTKNKNKNESLDGLIENLLLIENAFNEEKISLLQNLKEYQDKILKNQKKIESLSANYPSKDGKKLKGKKNQNQEVIKEDELKINRYQEKIKSIEEKIVSLYESLSANLKNIKEKFKQELNDFENEQHSISISQIRDIVNAYNPLPLSFNLFDSETFDPGAFHIASNKLDSEGTYARTQNKSMWWKYNLKDLENRFQDRVKDLIVKGKSENIGANTTRHNSVYMFKSSQEMTLTSPKSSNKPARKIKDDVLKHKLKVVNMLVNGMKNKTLKTLAVYENQIEAQYPCLMIQFKRPPCDINNEILPGYSEFVTHLMIAKINMVLKARGIEPLIDRRQSLGFLTPTLTDTHSAVRLSLGLTPNINWIEAVQDGIAACDKILLQLNFAEKKSKDSNIFICLDQYVGGDFTGYAHKLLEELTGGYTLHFTNGNYDELNKIQKRGICENEIYVSLTKDGFIYATNKTKHPIFVKHKDVNMQYQYWTEPENDKHLHAKIIKNAAKNGHFLTWDEFEEEEKNLTKNINLLQLKSKNKASTNKGDFIAQSCEIFYADSLPEDLTLFRDNYLLIKGESENNPLLYYIRHNKTAKEIKVDTTSPTFMTRIVNPLVRNKRVNPITKMKDPIIVGSDLIKHLTGTAHPIEDIANIPLEISKDDEIALEYTELYQRADDLLNVLANCWVQQHEDPEDSIIINTNIHEQKKSSSELLSKSNKIGHNFFTSSQDLVTFDTSDDDEPSVTNHEESTKNYRTPWGMGSLFSPMEALRRTLPYDNHPLAYSCMRYSYFEMDLSWNNSLSKDHFTRSDLVIDQLAYSVMGCLVIKFQQHPLIYPKEKNVQLIIDKREINKEAYKKFVNKYMHDLCNKNDNNITRNERIDDLYDLLSDNNKLFTWEDAEVLFEQIEDSTQQVILNTQSKTLQAYLKAKIYPTELVHIDANPCMTRKEKVVKVTDAIKQLSQSNPPPKVLVVDITSATQDQLTEIVEAFDKQDKIPLLVTAMSGLKHSQLGLDFFPYGENKIFRSKKCLERDKNLKEFCDTFSVHLKGITRGTEFGVSRVFRQKLTSSANVAESQKKKM